MRTSSGVVQMERVFLRWKKRGEVVMFARRPAVKVRTARARPRMVRYWKCQP